jgi:hypothetical protein
MGSQAAGARRRGRNEGSIYQDRAKGRWYGAVSFGYGPDGLLTACDLVSQLSAADEYVRDESGDV